MSTEDKFRSIEQYVSTPPRKLLRSLIGLVVYIFIIYFLLSKSIPTASVKSKVWVSDSVGINYGFVTIRATKIDNLDLKSLRFYDKVNERYHDVKFESFSKQRKNYYLIKFILPNSLQTSISRCDDIGELTINFSGNPFTTRIRLLFWYLAGILVQVKIRIFNFNRVEII
jgi:hypothetical protein